MRARLRQTLSCADAKRDREAWRAALPSAGGFPRDLPAEIPRITNRFGEFATQDRILLDAISLAGALYVDLDRSGAIQWIIQGAIELNGAIDEAYAIFSVSLPVNLAPVEYRVYDLIGRRGQLLARLTGNVELDAGVGFGSALPAFDHAALDAWMGAELPPVDGPTLAIADGQGAVYDPVRATWRVWTASVTQKDEPSAALDLGAAGVAVVIEPVKGTCASRWFGPEDPVGQVLCRIVTLPGGGARATRTTAGGMELVDIDEHGALRPRLGLPRARPGGVYPVASPRAELAWEQDGRVIVADGAGRRVESRGSPSCRKTDHRFCVATYARIIGGKRLLIEEEREPDHDYGHTIAVGRDDKTRARCGVQEIRHEEATSEALLGCETGWVRRAWNAADGAVKDLPQDSDYRPVTWESDPSHPLEVMGARVCTIGGWFYQGEACTGLQRWGKRGVLESVP